MSFYQILFEISFTACVSLLSEPSNVFIWFCRFTNESNLTPALVNLPLQKPTKYCEISQLYLNNIVATNFININFDITNSNKKRIALTSSNKEIS
jgi:hypothetical protein